MGRASGLPWSALALLGVALLTTSCGGGLGGVGVEQLRLGHGLDVSHPVHVAMEHLGDRLETLSGGALTLRIYPSEQLGSERECLELLQIGSLAMTKVSSSVLGGFAPDFKVLGTPYLFSSREHFFKTLDGDIGRRLLLSAESKRLRGLTFYDAGSRSFYTRERPVASPADLEGLKIRTQESATAMAMVRALGGAPTPISWGELYTALQQGVVDGAENNPPSFYLSRHYEVAKFYSLDEHTSVPDVLLIATEVWNRLDDQQRVWLEQAAADSAQVQRRPWKEAEDEALAAVKEAGVEVLRPEKAPFQERTRQLQDAFRDQPELFELVEQIRALDTAGSEGAP